MKIFLIIFSILVCIWLGFVSYQYKKGNTRFYQVIWNILNVIGAVALTTFYFISK